MHVFGNEMILALPYYIRCCNASGSPAVRRCACTDELKVRQAGQPCTGGCIFCRLIGWQCLINAVTLHTGRKAPIHAHIPTAQFFFIPFTY